MIIWNVYTYVYCDENKCGHYFTVEFAQYIFNLHILGGKPIFCKGQGHFRLG